MISNFTYRSDPVRIVFGAGAIGALAAEAELHNMTRLLLLCSKTRADFARRVDRGDRRPHRRLLRRRGPEHAARRVRAHPCRHQGAQCRRFYRGRRRLADRARQGRGGHDQAAVYRRRHHLFRLGNGAALVYRRRRPACFARARSGGAAGDRDLRSGIDARSAAARLGGERHERRWRMRSRAFTASTPIRSSRRWPRKPFACSARACRASCKIRASLPRARRRSTAPGSRQISAPRSGSNTPSRSACGNGSISTTRRPMPWRRRMRSALTPTRRPRRWRASSARSAWATRRAASTTSTCASGCRPDCKGLGLREEDIGKAVEVVAAANIAHPKPVSKADFSNIIAQAYAGAPPRF